jgi:hypothetical protein
VGNGDSLYEISPGTEVFVRVGTAFTGTSSVSRAVTGRDVARTGFAVRPATPVAEDKTTAALRVRFVKQPHSTPDV